MSTINPNLTRDGEGYVYWKGVHVEHYSYSLETMAEQAAELARRCEHLESIGVPVTTGSAVWCWTWFETMTADHWAKPLLATRRNWYESERGIGYMDGDTYTFWDGGKWNEIPGGGYHDMAAIGWHTPRAGQNENCGMVYATLEGLEEMFERHGLPVIADDVLGQAMADCQFPPYFSEMTAEQLKAYQTLRNAQNYLAGNGMAVIVAEES